MLEDLGLHLALVALVVGDGDGKRERKAEVVLTQYIDMGPLVFMIQGTLFVYNECTFISVLLWDMLQSLCTALSH